MLQLLKKHLKQLTGVNIDSRGFNCILNNKLKDVAVVFNFKIKLRDLGVLPIFTDFGMFIILGLSYCFSVLETYTM